MLPLQAPANAAARIVVDTSFGKRRELDGRGRQARLQSLVQLHGNRRQHLVRAAGERTQHLDRIGQTHKRAVDLAGCMGSIGRP